METTKAENTRRLARNTMMLYFRSIFCLVVSLWTSRLFLHALGVDDYGINNVVGGFASMFTLVTGALSTAISRFFTFELGTGNTQKQKQVFSISVTLMIVFSLIILLLALTFGDWFLGTKLNIPDGRERAAQWAFHCSIISVMTSLIVSPFNSAIIAHEKMGIYSVISIVEAVMRLALALFMTYAAYSMDRLMLYTLVWTAMAISLRVYAMGYAMHHFEETRYRPYFEKGLFKELFSYAGWNFISSVSGTLSGQGVNMLINIFYGAAVNAARGLSDTVQRSVSMFVNNFTIALTPQITKAYAAKDMSYVKYLTYRGSRFAYYIMFLISLPVILEADFVFTFWLGDVPEHAVNFNRLALIVCSSGLFFTVFSNVQNASGRIRNLRLIQSLVTLMEFPVSWVLLKIGTPPEVIYIVIFGAVLVNGMVTHSFVSKTMGYTTAEVFREVYIPEMKVIVCSTILPLVSVLALPYGWWRFLLTCTLCVCCTVPSILFLGCNASEREYIFNALKAFLHKMFPGKSK